MTTEKILNALNVATIISFFGLVGLLLFIEAYGAALIVLTIGVIFAGIISTAPNNK